MPDYSKCVIYTIKTGDGVYVGSTCNFNKRKCDHKRNINNEERKAYNFKIYKTIRENGGAWDMQPHSQFPCNSKMEMNIEEERVRKELNADLNMISCYGFDMKEYQTTYRLNNKDTHNKYIKEYQLANKDKIAEQEKVYRLKNKDKKREYDKAYQLKKKNELI